MDEGIRSIKGLSLGMLPHPKVISEDEQATKLGDAPSGIPSFFYQPSVILLEAIFLFVT
jgi:hypothetical protein